MSTQKPILNSTQEQENFNPWKGLEDYIMNPSAAEMNFFNQIPGKVYTDEL